MQDDTLVLHYQRNGLFYDGYVKTPDTEDSRVPFEQYDFSQMMMMVHALLLDYHKLGLTIRRGENQSLMPIQLAPDMVELLRVDPARYIKMHSIPPRTVDLRSKEKQRVSALVSNERYVIPKSTGLRAGLDTLAAAFGETIYLRMRNTFIEHPGTGRWSKLKEIERYIGTANWELLVTDDTKHAGWVTVPLKDLLATTTNKFYLPREWNTHGGWITREQLNELHAQFVEEKGALLCQSEVTTTS